MAKRKNLLILWLPVIFWAGLIFWGSSLPVMATIQNYWWDFALKKTFHLIEYFIFYILIYRALKPFYQKNTVKLFFMAFILILLYALMDEFHQSFSPGREPRIRDVFIDGLGGVLGIWFLLRWLPKMPKKLVNWVNV